MELRLKIVPTNITYGSGVDMAYCEMCGRPVRDEKLLRTMFIEGALLRVCESCYQKIVKKATPESLLKAMAKASAQQRRVSTSRWSKTRIPRRILEEEFEVVPDYAKRIREARERLGWTTKVLAEKVREKESVIRRIESGRLKPPIDLARRLERILGIKLLEPVVEEPIKYSGGPSGEDYFTIGDLIQIKTGKGKDKR